MADDHLGLDDQLASILARRAGLGRLRRLSTASGKVDFSSNSYLSLSSNPDVRNLYLSNLNSAGADFSLGSGGSRLLDGNSRTVEKLEKQIATFHRAPAGLLFNSGFEANTGLFSSVPQPNDVVIYDELVHASIHDGLRLSRAKIRIPFAHNVVSATTQWSNYESTIPHQSAERSSLKGLEEVFRHLLRGQSGEGIRNGRINVFIIVESLYSMDGDVAPLTEIVQCIQKHLPKGNGYLMVDEAHSTGIFDQDGQGLVCELGLEKHVWARVHTFGKAVGCSGAIVLCSERARQYLINYARSFVFTTAMGFPQLTSIRTCYDFFENGRAREAIQHLHDLSQHCRTQLAGLNSWIRPEAKTFRLQSSHRKSPIIAVLTNKPHSLAQYCQQQGYMVRPVVFPTVPKGMERVRVCLHAKNTIEEVNGLCGAIGSWLQLQPRDGTLYRGETVEPKRTPASARVMLVQRANL